MLCMGGIVTASSDPPASRRRKTLRRAQRDATTTAQRNYSAFSADPSWLKSGVLTAEPSRATGELVRWR